MRWTQPFRALAATLEKFLDRALCVIGAVLFSQIPEFFQQYLQRLGGHLDEARRHLDQFREAAAQTGVTVDQLASTASAQRDASVARLGAVIRNASARVESLASAEGALRGASLWTRPFVFLRHCDAQIVGATWSVFRPAVPTTVEGLVYAAVGMVLMLALYHGAVRYPLRRAQRARASRRIAAAV